MLMFRQDHTSVWCITASPYKCLDVIHTHLCRVFFLSLVALVVFLKQQLHSAVSEISCCFPRLLEMQMHNYMASLKDNLGGFSYHFANDTSQPKRDPKNNMNHQTRVSPGVFLNSWSFNHDYCHVGSHGLKFSDSVARFHFHSATPMYREDSERAIFWGALLGQVTKRFFGAPCRIRNRPFFLAGAMIILTPAHQNPVNLHCYMELLDVAARHCTRPKSYGKGWPCLKEPTKLYPPGINNGLLRDPPFSSMIFPRNTSL